MPTDVIIDPANGQIYWNDGTGSPQSIAIGGNALDTISVSGYSAAYSPGSTPAASAAGTLVKFTDAAQATLTPGTNAYELGSGSLRWKFFGTTTNISDNGSALGTNTFSLTTGLVQINGGIAISGNAGVAQTLFHYNPNDPRYYVGFRSSASLASTQTYTFPLTYPSTGSSILQSDTAGTLTWVPMTAASASASTALNINIVSATTGTFFPLFTNTSTTANGIAGVAVSVDSMFSFDAASNVLIVDGATMGGLGLTTTFASFDIGNTAAIAQTLNFSNTTTGQVQYNFGTASASASTATFFGSVNSNRMILNVNSSGNVFIQTNQVNARVRLFQNNTTGNVSIFGTGGGTLYLGEDTTTNNADIALRGTVLNGGGGNVRAAVFSISTATSNGSGVGGTIQFQTSTSGNPTGNLPNALRTRLRIEGAATGTSSLESIIILGDATSGTAWSSFLRGVDATGTDVDAGEIQIQSGRSTGTGAARGISFYVSPSSTTSATINAASQIARFSATGLTVYSTTPSTSTVTGALIVAGGAGIGGSLYTATGNPASVSGVVLSNGIVTSGSWNGTVIAPQYGGTGLNNSGQSGILKYTTGTGSLVAAPTGAIVGTTDSQNLTNKTYNNVTVTAPATNATITIADTTTFATSGAFNLTLTTTALTNVTLPSGTKTLVATDVTSLASLTTASSLNSIGTISTGVWAATAITTAYGGHGAIPAVSKGDILVGAGNTWYNFPYSASNDQVLTVDTTLPFGLKWATPSASASSVSVAASAGSTVLFLTSTNNSTGGGLALSTVTTLSYNTVANTLSSTGVTATYVRALQYLIPIGGNNIAWYASDGTTQLMGINTSNGWLRSYQTTNATSTTSASLVSSGGLSVATNAMIGGTATIFSTTSATGISSGAFNVVGGASINGNAFIGGTTNITSTSASGTTASGALVVTGGVGIGGSVNIGKSLNLWNPAYTFSTNLASGAATSTITYILPPGPPNGLGTSVLSSSNTGILSWIPQLSGSSSGIADSVKVYGLGAQTYYLTMAPSFSGAATSLFSDANFAFESTTSTLILGYTLKMSSGTAISNQTFNSPSGYTFTPSVDSASSFVINNTAGFALFAFDASTGSTNLRINRSGVLRLYAPANNFYTGLQGGVATSNITYLLPPGPPNGLGTSILSSSNTGVMSWIPQSTGGSGSPGGSNKQIQYNNSSTFGGAGGFEFTTGGIANTVSIFSTSGTGYTVGLWVSAIGGTTRVGIGLSNPQFELEILGEISATNKSFVINHPTKPNMKLRYGSLEGPENGVYVRGILIGNNIIETPDYWVGLVDPDTFTVDLTPIGKFAQLYVQKIEDYKVYVGNSSAFNIHCFYTVWAERKDIPKLVTEY